MKRLLAAGVLLCLLPLSAAHAWQGKVVRVLDGDTVQVQRGGTSVRIRLYGIDCPETNQPYGDTAKAFTKVQMLHRQVQVEEADIDLHGRTVALIRSSGRLLNRELVRAGYAWAYRQYCKQEPLCKEFSALEKAARQQKQGLWQGRRPVAPWDWRQGKRQ